MRGIVDCTGSVVRAALLGLATCLWATVAFGQSTSPAGRLGVPSVFAPEPDGRYWTRLRGHDVHSTPTGLELSATSGAGGAVLRYVGGAGTSVSGRDRLPVGVSRYLGNDRYHWLENVPGFAGTTVADVWPGIDAVVTLEAGTLKTQYLVAAGADHSDIRLQWSGAIAVVEDASGRLQVELAHGTLIEAAPVCWQPGPTGDTPRDCRFSIPHAGRIGFDVDDVDPSRPLVVDPAIYFSALIGGEGADEAVDVSRGSDPVTETFVVCGHTQGPGTGSPALPGAPATSANTDVYVAQYTDNGTLSSLTWLGGQKDEVYNLTCPTPDGCPNDIGLIPNPNGLGGADVTTACAQGLSGTVVGGWTFSVDFPVKNAAQGTHADATGTLNLLDANIDGFVLMLAPDGTLAWSTYLGGDGADRVNGVAYDGAMLAVVGSTNTADFPTTSGVLDGANPEAGASQQQGFDGFITTFNPQTGARAASTYLGSAGYESLRAVDIDATTLLVGGVRQAGQSDTVGTVQAVSGDLKTSAWATELSGLGSGFDSVYALEYSAATGRIWVGGVTMSPDLGDSLAAEGGTCPPDDQCGATNLGAPFWSGFVQSLKRTDGSTVTHYYLGGSSLDRVNDLSIGTDGKTLHVAGWTMSDDFPTRAGFQKARKNVRGDAFYSVLDVSTDGAASLLLSTYLGSDGGAFPQTSSVVGDVAGAFQLGTSSSLIIDEDESALGVQAGMADTSAYVAGWTETPEDFPDTWAQKPQGYTASDAVPTSFLAKINIEVADLSVGTITTVPAAVEPGATFEYRVVLHNAGPLATSGKLKVTLHEELDFQATPGCNQPDAANTPALVECAFATIPRLGTHIVAFKAKAPSRKFNAKTRIEVIGLVTDPDTANNQKDYTHRIGGVNLGVAASHAPEPVATQRPVKVSFHVTNASTETEPSAQLNVSLPSGFVYVSGPSGCIPPGSGLGETVVCSLSSMAPNAQATVTLSLKSPPLPGAYPVRGEVVGTQTDANPNDNVATTDVTVKLMPDLVVSLSDSFVVDPVSGTQLKYTATVTNTGEKDATATTVTLELDAQLTPGAAPSGCSWAGQTLTCLTTVDAAVTSPAHTRTFELLVDTPIVLGQSAVTVTSTLQAIDLEDDGWPADNKTSKTTTLGDYADLAVILSDDRDPLQLGGVVTYAATIYNNGFKTADGLNVQVELSGGGTPALPSGAPCALVGTTGLLCPLSSLAPASSTTITWTITAPEVETVLSAKLTATTSTPLLVENQSWTETTQVRAMADLVMSVSAPAKNHLNDPLKYTLSIKNQGKATAKGVMLVTTSAGGGAFGAIPECNGLLGDCTIGDLAPGASKTFIAERSGFSEAGPVSLTSTAIHTDIDADATSDKATAQTQIFDHSTLKVTVTGTPTPVPPSDPLTFGVTVVNQGPDTATVPSVAITVPPELVNPTLPSACTATGNTLTCVTNWTLAVGQSNTLSIVGTAPSKGDKLTMTATAWIEDDFGQLAPFTGTGTAKVLNGPDLNVLALDTPDPVEPEADFSYQVLVSNNGTEPAENVVLTITLPAAATLKSNPPGCTLAAHALTCPLGTLGVGGGASAFTVPLTAPKLPSGTSTLKLTGVAFVTQTTDEADATDDLMVVPTVVGETSKLGVSITDSKDPVGTKQSLSYQLTVANAGTADANQVTAIGVLSGSPTSVSVSAPCVLTGNIFQCTWPTINAGTQRTALFSMTTPESEGVVSLETTSVTKVGGTDPDSNVVVKETTQVKDLPELDATLVLSPNPSGIEKPVTASLSVKNKSQTKSVSIVRVRWYSKGLDALSTAPGCTATGYGMLCGGPTLSLAPGATETWSFTATSSKTPGKYDHAVHAKSDGTDSLSDFETRVFEVSDGPDLRTTITAQRDPVPTGKTATTHVSVHNAGSKPATNAKLVWTVPAGVSASAPSGCTASSPGLLECALGTLAPNATANQVFTWMAPATPTSVVLSFVALSDEADADSNDNIVKKTVAVEEMADLLVTGNYVPTQTTPESTVSHVVSITNQGDTDATDVRVIGLADGTLGGTLPSGCTWQTLTTQRFRFTCKTALLTKAGGTNPTITWTIPVKAPKTVGAYTTSLSAFSSSTDGDHTNNTLSVPLQVGDYPDPSVVLTHTPSTVNTGGSFTLTATTSNLGTKASQGVVLSVTVPSEASGLQLPAGCSVAGTVVTCAVGTLAKIGDAGAEKSYAFAMTAPAQELIMVAAASLTSTDAQEIDPSNNVAADYIPVGKAPKLTAWFSAQPTSKVGPSRPLGLTLHIRNDGQAEAQQVSAVLTPDPSFNTTVPNGCTAKPASGQYDCPLGSLAVGSTTTVGIGGTAPSTSGVHLITSALVSHQGTSLTSDPPVGAFAHHDVEDLPDLAAALTVVPDPTSPGKTVVAQATLLNLGTKHSNQGYLELSSATVSLAAAAGCSLSGNTVRCPGAGTVSLAPGASTSWALSLKAPTQKTPHAILATALGETDELDSTNNYVTGLFDVKDLGDGALTWAVGAPKYGKNSTGTATLTVENIGTDTFDGGVAYVTPPSGFSGVSAAGCNVSGNQWACALGTLATGATQSWAFGFTTPSTDGQYLFTGALTPAGDDAELSNNSAFATVVVGPRPKLGVSVVAVPTTVDPNEAGATFVATVTNSGDDAATNPVITLSPNPAFTNVSAAGCSGTPLTCPLSSVPAGASTTVTLSVTAPPAEGTYGATAVVSGWAEQGATEPNPTATGLMTVKKRYDLVAQLGASSKVATGKPITWTLTTTNTGELTAPGATATITLPAGVTVTNAGGCTGVGKLTCNLGDLAPLQSQIVTLVGTAPTQPGVLLAQASVSPTADDAEPTDNVDFAQTSVEEMADLALSFNAPAFTTPGGTVTVAATVENTGSKTASNAQLAFTIPAQVSGLSHPLCAVLGTQVRCALGDLAPSASLTRSFTFTVPNTTGAVHVPIVAVHPGDDAMAPDQATASIAIENRPDLAVAVSFSAPAAATSTPITASVVVSNLGTSLSSGGTLSMLIPTGVSQTSAPGCTVVGSTATCPIAGLAPAASVTIPLTYIVPALPTTLTQTASVSTPDAQASTANDTTSTTLPVVVQPNLGLSYAVTPNPVLPSGTATWTLTVENTGDGAATNVVVNTGIPTTVQNLSFGPGCSNPSAGQISCAVGTVAAGGSAVATFSYTPAVAAAIQQSATVGADQLDRDPANNSATATLNAVDQPDLALTLTLSPDPVGTGAPVTGTVTVDNLTTSAGADAVDAQVVLALPSGVSNASAPAQCAVTSTQITCPLGTVSAGGQTSFTFGYHAPGSAGSLSQSAAVSFNGVDKSLTNNNQTQTIAVAPKPDLAVSLSGGPSPAGAGDMVTFTASAQNVGGAGATGVTVTLPVPNGVSAISPGPGCALAGLNVECAVGPLSAGANQTFSLTWNAPSSGGSVTQSAAIAGNESDDNLTNNSATATIAVTGKPDLAAVLNTFTTTSGLGEQVSVDIGVTNLQPVTATAVQVVLTLPAGVANISAPTCGVNGTTVTCTEASLGPNLLPTHSVTFNAPSTAGPYTAVVAVSATQPDLDPQNNTTTATFTAEARPNLSVSLSATPNPVASSGTATWTAAVENTGVGTASQVVTRISLNRDVLLPQPGSGCVVGQGAIVCTTASLPAGQTAQYQFTHTVRPLATSLALTATVGSTELDQDTADNSDTYVLTVNAVDTDGDGIADAVEDAGPNRGDADNDGVKDRLQQNLASLPSTQGTYVTLKTSAGTLASVTVGVPSTVPPAGVGLPLGAIDFQVQGLPPGGTAIVTVTLPAGVPAFKWWKYGKTASQPTAQWYDFAFDGTTGAQVTGTNTITLTLQDGGRGDDDLTANGVVVDPGGPMLRRLVVNSTGEASDAFPGDGLCATAIGECTLHAAFAEVNAHPDPHTIEFGINGQAQLILTSPLPALTVPVVLDGTTQAGFTEGEEPVVEVNGWSLDVQVGLSEVISMTGGSAVFGLSVTGGENAVRVSGGHGFVMSHCQLGFGVFANLSSKDSGLRAEGVNDVEVRRSFLNSTGNWFNISGAVTLIGSSGHLIADNRVGIGSQGFGSGNQYAGIWLEDVTDTLVTGNVIDFNQAGVHLEGSGTSGVVIEDNLFGLDEDGTCTVFEHLQLPYVPNAGPCVLGNEIGVKISGGATGNTVGGTTPLSANTFSNSNEAGVQILGGSNGNTILGNRFGTTVHGTCEIALEGRFCRLKNDVGLSLYNAVNNTVGGPVPEAHNLGMTVRIEQPGSFGNVLEGFSVGIDAYGRVTEDPVNAPVNAFGFRPDGIRINNGATNNTIKGATLAACDFAVYFDYAGPGNIIEDSFIGTDTDGATALGTNKPVWVWHSSGQTLRGNVIANNRWHGIAMYGDSDTNLIEGNTIGLAPDGITPLMNTSAGIFLDGEFFAEQPTGNIIRGNVISANGMENNFYGDFEGIRLLEGVTETVIEDNTIGSDSAVTVARGNRGGGIRLIGSPQNTLRGNTIAGNLGPGITLVNGKNGDPSSFNGIYDNTVGIAADGTALPNTGAGMVIGSEQNTVGETGADQPNHVAYNDGPGVQLNWSKNRVIANSIHDNEGLGIDHGGFGVDPLGNGFIDRPTLTTATVDATSTTVNGTLSNLAANTNVLISIYRSPTVDAAGYGEGQFYLGEANLVTSGAFPESFSVTLPTVVADGEFITATVTDPTGQGTSEFSNFLWVGNVNAADIAVDVYDTVGGVLTNQTYWWGVVENKGPADATDVVLTLPVPATMTYVSATAGGACTHDPQADVITCPIGTLTAGSSQIFEVYVQPTVAGLVTLTATATTASVDPNPGSNTDSDDALISPANLSVALEDSTDPVAIGQEFDVTVTVTNSEYNDAIDAQATYLVEPDAVVVSAQSAAGPCTTTAYSATCPVGTLKPYFDFPDNSAAFVVTVRPTVAGQLDHSATASSSNPETDPSDNTGTTSTTVVTALTDLSFVVSADPTPAAAGGPLTWTAQAQNLGPSEVSDATISFSQSADLQTVSISKGSCDTQLFFGTTLIDCTVGSLAKDEVVTLTVATTVPSNVTTLSGGGSITSSVTDTDPLNDNDTVDVLIDPADVASAVAGPAPVDVGTSSTFTFTVSNQGPETATQTQAIISYPFQMEPDTETLPVGCSPSGGSVVCQLGDLVSGASLDLPIAFVPQDTGSYTLELYTYAQPQDPDQLNNTATLTTDASKGPATDLQLVSATDSPDPANTGSPLTFDLSLANNGPSDATGVVLTATFDDPVTLPPGTVGCALDAQEVTCSVPDLTSGATSTFSLTVVPGKVDTLYGTFEIQSQNDETSSWDNLAYTDTVVNPGFGCPAGTQETLLLEDDFEDGLGGWSTFGYVASFIPTTQVAQSGVTSLTGDVMGIPGDRYLQMTAPIIIPATASYAPMRFAHRYLLDNTDGTVLEYSLDGLSWQSAESLVLNADYGFVSSFANSPLRNTPAWANGQNPSWPGFDSVLVDLGVFAGARVWLRFRMATDETTGSSGYWIDDVSVRACAPAPVPGDADLGVAWSGFVEPQTGAETTLELTVSNDGPETVAAPAVTVEWPDALALPTDDGGATCSVQANTLSCGFGALSSGETATVILTTLPVESGVVSLTATVSGSSSDPGTANDQATMVRTVLNGYPCPEGSTRLVLFEDGGDNALGNWTTSATSGGAAFMVDGYQAHTGANAFHVTEPGVADDIRLQGAIGFPIPAGAASAHLSFWHWYDFQYDDGGILELSTNGTVWTNAEPRIVEGGYDFTVSQWVDNPLANQAVWTDGSNGIRRSVVDLTDLQGQTVWFRFRAGFDSWSSYRYGWWIDDIRLDACPAPLAPPEADLAVTWTGPTTAGTGAPVALTATVQNPTGPDEATNVSVVIDVGALSSPSVSFEGTPCPAAGSMFTCNLGALPVGESAAVTVSGQLDSDVALNASVEATEADPNAGNDSAEQSITAVPPFVDLTTTLFVASNPGYVDEPGLVTLTVSNTGNSPEPTPTVSLDIPSELALGALPAGCTAGQSTVDCVLTALGADQQHVLEFALTPAAVGVVMLDATVSGSITDDNPFDNSASAEWTLQSRTSDVSVGVVGTPNPATVGEPIVLTATVDNQGPDTTEIAVWLALDQLGANPVAATTTNGTCSLTADGAFCPLGALAAGTQSTVTLNVLPDEPGTLRATATLVSALSDPSPENDVSITLLPVVWNCNTLVCDDGEACTSDWCTAVGGCQTAPFTGACDDGDACTTGDACTEGACLASTATDCDDGDQCTVDICDPALGCIHTESGDACDDGDPCTVGDVCAGGGCFPGVDPLECDDDDPCTDDVCLAGVGCDQVPNTAPCDDGSACTTGDTCSAGSCLGQAVECDDGDVCTTDSCDLATGCVTTANAADCDDGDPCTIGETCATGTCAGGQPNPCDDGDVCTADSCDAQTGCIHSILPGCCTQDSDCADGDPCTDDACDLQTGDCLDSVLAANSTPCDDGDPCTVGDVCNDGLCESGAGIPDCDDGQACTFDFCTTDTGCTTSAAEENGLPCDDDNPCTTNDACADGQCTGPVIPCNDGDPCTTDFCDPADGQCQTAPGPDGEACDDGELCTDDDSCVAGTCVGGEKDCSDGDLCTDDLGCEDDVCQYFNIDCDDQDPCTTDTCAPETGCVFTAIAGCCTTHDQCDDSNACTTESCVGNVCVSGAPVVCDDGDACTTDSCVPDTGCTTAPVDGCCVVSADCDDNNGCTEETCTDNVCIPTAKVCNDGNPCTTDSCVPDTGECVHLETEECCLEDIDCSDDDACTELSCVENECISAPTDCDDGNACTTDNCDSVQGCLFTTVPSCCEQDADCVDVDLCTDLTCVEKECASSPTDCDDGNPCTVDLCVPETGCAHNPQEDCCQVDAQCDDDNACSDDTCSDGACLYLVISCWDDTPCTVTGCDPATGCTTDYVPGCCAADADCDDGDGCTLETCDLASGDCQQQAAPDETECDDENSCTLGDACETGECVGAAVDCDDENPCTTDLCDDTEGCVSTPNTTDCEDGDVCTQNDACFQGACAGSTVDCDDDNPCTDDACAPDTGCVHTPNAVSCSDGDACTQNDTCTEGDCVGTAVTCDDGDQCTADTCDAETGCQYSPTDLACDDGNACTEDDICDGGECGGTEVTCSDGDPCTADGCDSDTGCTFTALPNCDCTCELDTDCDDDDPCTVDSCDACECATEPLCDDGLPCTDDACALDEVGAVCSTTPTICDDENACTNDTCGEDGCEFASVACDDGDPCTTDSCDPTFGCASELSAGTPCDDANPCTTDDSCGEAGCGGSPVVCSDDDACTLDSCDPLTGQCVFAPTDGLPCDDGEGCTDNDSCSDGQCSGTAKDCDDGTACTTDACESATGDCVHTALPECCESDADCTDNDACTAEVCESSTGECQFPTDPNDGTVCDDGDPCTLGDVCGYGGCTGTPNLCDDGDDCTEDACEPAGCTNTPIPGCACAPQYAGTICHDGDVWWVDGCGQLIEVAASCDDALSCTEDLCVEDTCVHKASPDCTDSCVYDEGWVACAEGHLTAFDGCGHRLGIVEPCTTDDQCVESACDDDKNACVHIWDGEACDEPQPTPECVGDPVLGCSDDENLVWFDSCGNELDLVMECDDKNPVTNDTCDDSIPACVFEIPPPDIIVPPDSGAENGAAVEMTPFEGKTGGCDGCATHGDQELPWSGVWLFALALLGLARRKEGVR